MLSQKVKLLPRFLLRTTQRKAHTMDLDSVVGILKKMFPLEHAWSKDNVGLLVEPSQNIIINNILLTNDLTEKVMDEAIEKKTNLIYSYHPPIFHPLKRIVRTNWKDRNVIRCLENRIAIYSPHTAADAADGGVDDWLLSSFPIQSIQPIQPAERAFDYCLSLKTEALGEDFAKLSNILIVNHQDSVEVRCKAQDLSYVLALLGKQNIELNSIDKISKVPQPVGMGRLAKLSSPLTISEAVDKMKRFLGLSHLRLALGVNHGMETPITTVAVCPGSGGSTFEGVQAQLFITGELSHHEALDLTHQDSSVILCEHSNSERGYLVTVQKELQHKLGNAVNINISLNDHDPMIIV